MRLLVLSRNLTRDRSWDISLCLDGDTTRRVAPINKSVVDLLKRLPQLTVHPVSEEVRALTLNVASDLNRVVWNLPEPFDTVTLAVSGIGSETWSPLTCARMGVISPFCDDTTFGPARTPQPGRNRCWLDVAMSWRPVRPKRSPFSSGVCVLDDMAASEDGEEAEPESLQGLHAKAFIQEVGWDTVLTVGSGNATQAALANRQVVNNVEVFATLTGKASKVGQRREHPRRPGFRPAAVSVRGLRRLGGGDGGQGGRAAPGRRSARCLQGRLGSSLRTRPGGGG